MSTVQHSDPDGFMPGIEQMSREDELFDRIGISPDVSFRVANDRRSQQALQYVGAEVYNDSYYDFATVTDDDKLRLHFVVVPTMHTEQFALDVARKIAGADYILLESVGFTEDQRLAIDTLDNVLLRGAEVAVDPNTLAALEVDSLIRAADWRSMIQRVCGGDPTKQPPIFRMIDMASDDPVFDERYASTELLSVATKNLDLYGRPFDDVRAEAKEQLLAVGEIIRAREAEQLEDILHIAAKAVTLHPEKDHIEIGISIGAAHSMVARHLERAGLSVDTRFAGPAALLPHDALTEGGSEFSYALDTALIRKATHAPEHITDNDINCVIAYRLISNALQPRLLDTFMAADGNATHAFGMIVSELVYSLNADQHLELLDIAQLHHISRLNPFFKTVRLIGAMARTNHAVMQYLQQNIGDLDTFATDVVEELRTR